MPFPVDAKWIKETEVALGVRFPASYVVAMCKSNGGSVEVASETFWLHPIYDQSSRKLIQRTCNSVCRETQSLRALSSFPDDFVTIAHSNSGDALVFKPRSDDPEVLEHSVYHWDRDASETQLIADDFSDLIITG